MRTTSLSIRTVSILLAVPGRITLPQGSSLKDGHVKGVWTKLTRQEEIDQTCDLGVLGLAPLTAKQPKIIILRLSSSLI